MTKTTTQNQAIREALGWAYPDKVIRKKDRGFEARRTFFYRHGGSAETWADTVVKAVAAQGFDPRVVRLEEIWRDWPKDSYWTVTFTV